MADPPPKRRGKSLATKAEDALKQYSTVQCKLNKVIRKVDHLLTEALFDLFQKCTSNVTRIAHEAYLLSEYHLLRLLEAKKPLPELNQSFFKSCCVLVSATEKGVQDEELSVSMDSYRALRPVDFDVPFNEHMSPLMSTLAREMATMTDNHIMLNFPSRLLRYVRLRYKLDRRTAESFVIGTFRDSVLCEDQKAFKEWLIYNPSFDSEIKKHNVHFIEKLHDIQKYYDTLPEDTKGVRRFSLLPKKEGFIGTFILIDETTLPVILKLMDRTFQEFILRLLMSQLEEGSEDHDYLRNRLLSQAVFPTDFHTKKELSHALWHLLFDVSGLETANRKFRYILSTNGYAATVYLQKPKEVTEREYDPFPSDVSQFQSFIGIDPGQTYVCTAFDGKDTVQVSNKEIRNDSKATEHAKWTTKMRERETDYTKRISELPSLRTGSLERYKDAVRVILSHSGYLFGFCEKKVFRAWRFKLSRFSKKAYSKAARKVICGRKGVLIGFGDWSQQDGFLKGKPKAGVEKLKKELRTLATVVEIDEFRTSKSCSCCCIGEVSNLSYNGVRCHEAVRCGNNECGISWQRDFNASRNMRRILMTKVNKEERPTYLKRRKKNSPKS